jgi:hypothetical protein
MHRENPPLQLGLQDFQAILVIGNSVTGVFGRMHVHPRWFLNGYEMFVLVEDAQKLHDVGFGFHHDEGRGCNPGGIAG